MPVEVGHRQRGSGSFLADEDGSGVGRLVIVPENGQTASGPGSVMAFARSIAWRTACFSAGLQECGFRARSSDGNHTDADNDDVVGPPSERQAQ
jgi:hypothetical protein